MGGPIIILKLSAGMSLDITLVDYFLKALGGSKAAILFFIGIVVYDCNFLGGPLPESVDLRLISLASVAVLEAAVVACFFRVSSLAS